MPKRRIYLDIDGVVNALGPEGLPGAHDEYFERQLTVPLGGGSMKARVTVTVAPVVIERLNDWIERGVEVVHATTWESWAAKFDKAVGLPVLPYVRLTDKLNFEDWKGIPVRTHWDRDPSDLTVWLEDDLKRGYPGVGPSLVWAKQIGARAIAPISAIGLDLPTLGRIEEYLFGG